MDHSRRDRIMGKLFGGASLSKDKKLTQEESANEISSFLGGADKLTVTHPVPPPPPHTAPSTGPQSLPALALDTSKATRYPQASDVGSRSQQSLAYRARSHSPPRPKKKKGLIVRFSDNYPEIIGEGGDECETVVAEIGRRKRSRSVPMSAPLPPTKQGHEYARQIGAAQEVKMGEDGFVPGPIRRTQTGVSVSDLSLEGPRVPPKGPSPKPPQPRTIAAGEPGRSRFLDSNPGKDENRRSFIEIQQQAQRQAEAMAFAEATRSASANSHHDWEDSSSPEPVRETPPGRGQRQPPSSQDSGSPSPLTTYGSLRTPPTAPQAPSPLRAFAGNSPLSLQPPSDGLAPIPPPKSTRRSPLQPSPVLDAQSPFRDPPKLQQVIEDELRINTNVDDSPSSMYSGSVYSASDLNKATPGVQTPGSRGRAPSSPELTRRGVADAASAGNDEALELFNARTKHLYELFRLYAEQLRPLESCQPEDLCRAALWWFLKGRSALEAAIRSRPANPDDTRHLMARYQAYTDLAKGYWLVEVALGEIAGGKYTPVSGELGEVRTTLSSNLKKLAVSMKRNGLLPPEEPFLPQTMDKSVWIEYPAVSQDIVALLNGVSGSVLAAAHQPARSMDLLEALPLGDTNKFFNYGRVPAHVYLTEQGGVDSTQTCFPCLVSVLRPPTDLNIMFVIASQNGTVALRVQSDKNAGATWQDVKWKPDTCALEVKLPRGFLLVIQCSQQDYRMLWSIYDFASKVQAYLYPMKEETVAYNTVLRGFHYFDSNPQSRTFPKEPVGQCELVVFERLLREGSPHGPRTFHRGFRIGVVTGPRIRTLSGVTHPLPPQLPIQFAFLRGDQRAPILQLEFYEGKDKGRMVMTFKDDGEREKMLKLLNGTYVHHDEEVVAEVELDGMNMSDSVEDTKGGFPAVQRLPWQRARIINDRYAGENPVTVLAEKLRIEVESLDKGGVGVVSTITDRVNVAPGEVRLRLRTKDILTLQVLRQPQQDMTISVSENLAPRETAREFAVLQNSVARSQTVRTYRFHSFKDLHAFQAGLTGYTVLFDGVATTLNISRRRMVVPIHKKWDAGTTRIQVVQQDKTIQLLAFFEDWHHGQCMGFVLKGTDVFEAFSRNGKVGLKLCEAKFPLPKVPAESEGKTDEMAFLCLDMPDYAGENDDISIVFDDITERDRLCAVLPAPVKGSRRSVIKS
ncbi:hypothetical protein DL764_002736 [Monosporascus ibericus]|uniref:Uncharacterized protein n=1 Tax=Monosporascus ibericus TaxID=155417 RepID=A0A4Q4TLT9_9PEZI|nr:hypothetical protein DL764_002736 [Monosporascus ibericus]